MFLRAIRYCSTFDSFITEREKIRMALLLNKYPNKIIDQQFRLLLKKYTNTHETTENNYRNIRKIIIESPEPIKGQVDYASTLFVHFTYCVSMRRFPEQFHSLWTKYFENSPLSDIRPILGTRNTNNLCLEMAIIE